MRKILYVLVLLTGIANAQLVTIPDANFKAKLIALGIDTNTDGAIQQSEAQAITSLDISNSNIADLTGILSFTSLSSLNCSANQLVSLNVSGITTLVTLSCYGNQLTALNFTNCPGLKTIDCTDNRLTTLDFTGQATSNPAVYCSHNAITTFTFANNMRMLELRADDNQISYLDLSKVRLSQGNFWQNPFLAANFKNGYDDNFFGIAIASPTDPLKYLCLDESEEERATFQEFYEANEAYLPANLVVNTYCTFNPGGTYNTITAKLTADLNNNGCDTADWHPANVKFTLNDGTNSGSAFTDVLGSARFFTQAGSFVVTPVLENPTWFNISPPSVTLPFTDANNNAVTQDFCLTANGVHNDVEVLLVPLTNARPGFDAQYRVVVKNIGNTALSDAVQVVFDTDRLHFVSAVPALDFQNPNYIGWIYTSLLPFETRTYVLTLHLNGPMDTPPVNIGDVLSFNTFSIPLAGDETPENNAAVSLHQTVTGSFDPNDIQCLEGTTVAPSQIGKYLHYNINFENTGTAEAENIVVKNTIDATKFDISSLQLLGSSTSVSTKITGNVAEFIFKNIQLDPAAHGSLTFKIKTRNTLTVGDSVTQEAAIYFDYNFPVLTDPAITVFQTLSSPTVPTDASISVYPNPTRGNISIQSVNTLTTMELFDIQGRLLQTRMVNETQSTLDISTQPKGIYFLKVQSDKGTTVQKIIKQ